MDENYELLLYATAMKVLLHIHLFFNMVLKIAVMVYMQHIDVHV